MLRLLLTILLVVLPQRVPSQTHDPSSPLPLERMSPATWQQIDRAHELNPDPKDLAELMQNFIYATSDRNMTEDRIRKLATLANTRGQNFGLIRNDGTKQYTAAIILAEYQQTVLIKTAIEQLKAAQDQIQRLEGQVQGLCSILDQKVRPAACATPKQ